MAQVGQTLTERPWVLPVRDRVCSSNRNEGKPIATYDKAAVHFGEIQNIIAKKGFIWRSVDLL